MNRAALHALLLLISACGFAACATAARQASTAPATAPAHERVDNAQLNRAIAQGVEYLKTSQQPDGSWGTGLETRGLEIYSMVPGSHDAFRVATTALCVMALQDAGEVESRRRGVEYLIAQGKAYRDSGTILYNVWAHTYGLQALAIEMRANPDPRVKEAAEWHLDRMIRYATYIGGWNYYDFGSQTQQPSLGPTSFGTAAGLVALYEARKSGLDVPQVLIDRSLRRLEECRMPTGVYLYSHDLKYNPRLPANHDKGAVGRTQPSNYALWLWDHPRIGQDESIEGLALFFEHHIFLAMGRKRPRPHEAWYQTSGYYYYFDHYYAALIVERLPEPQRNEYAHKLAAHVLPHQEPDGSWWDYAMWDYHKPYGTAFAIMTLLRCGAP